MKAVRYYGPEDIRIEEVPAPEVEPGGILVEVECCAICGTDFKAYYLGNPRIKPPQTLGHEFVGKVFRVTPEVMSFQVGDRVTMATSISCGQCNFCRLGQTNRCSQLTPISYDYPGAFADYIAVPARGVAGGFVVKVPEGLDEEACLAEPISCAVNSQIIAGVKPGDTVVVIGAGPMGAIHTQVARANGAEKIIVTQRSKTRLTLAENFGADAVIDVTTTESVDEVKRLTNGLGADVAIVTAPEAIAQEQAFYMVKKGGMVNLFASLPKGVSDLQIDSRLIHYNEIFLSGASDSTAKHVEIALQFLSKRLINPGAIITHRLPLTDFHQGIQLLKERKALKILLKP
ncbi:MAG: alcohol dehydrogenase catalytic domain-containing protein [Candidatus Omnitrophota bacterium]